MNKIKIVVKLDDTWKVAEVDIKKVVVIDGVKIAVHRPLNYDPVIKWGGWNTSEFYTGSLISHAQTIKDAVEIAERRINKLSGDTMRERALEIAEKTLKPRGIICPLNI